MTHPDVYHGIPFNVLQIRKATQDQLELPATDIRGAVSLRVRQTSELHLPLRAMPWQDVDVASKEPTDKAASQNVVYGIIMQELCILFACVCVCIICCCKTKMLQVPQSQSTHV